MNAFLEEYTAYCEHYGKPDRIELLLSDLNGILRGKWLPGEAANKIAEGEIRIPLATYAPSIMGYDVEGSGLGIEVGDPDGTAQPIHGTLSKVPWREGNSAQLMIELQMAEGEISAQSAREILKKSVRRLGDMGFMPVIATELEFYIMRPRATPDEPPQPPIFSPETQNLDLAALEQHQLFLNDVRRAAEMQQLPCDTLIAEYGPGQFEINFKHVQDACQAAETALLFRRLVRGIAQQHGLEASFMAKPYEKYAGNGFHTHVSLVNKTGENMFSAGNQEEIAPNLRNAIAGLLATLPEMQAIFAPHSNSYRRFQNGSFAPSNLSWGIDHRAAAIRVPAVKGMGARLEHRISGADANPYLVLSAILGGIAYGLEHKPELPEAIDQPHSTQGARLAKDWTKAIDIFASSSFAHEVFGAYRDLYALVKRAEIDHIESKIPPAEYKYYLSKF